MTKGSGMEDGNMQEQVIGNLSEDKSCMPSSKQEEEAVKKKYGGIMPKKPPLISKDHERAFFDSADWALGKQGVEKPKGPLEALRPKLQVESWRMSLGVFSKGFLDKLQLELNESGNYLTMMRGMDLDNSACVPTEEIVSHLSEVFSLLLQAKPTQQQTRYRKSPYAPADGEGANETQPSLSSYADGGSAPSEDATANE
ncbi:hypothetical protein POTOM_053984 [Populus tomentosa]|uniref:Uncharacterized protein n=1 Tax=Populus tomentosa TaxID=118781 RepID=A0A8X7Y2T0_POPTO|nr:hypothetical protein POTOM_053984 [Populus tomentosa]